MPEATSLLKQGAETTLLLVGAEVRKQIRIYLFQNNHRIIGCKRSL